MAAIKMAAVNSSTLLLMNLWTAFMELPETWIACAHPDGAHADMDDYGRMCKRYWPACRPGPESGPSHCKQTGQSYVAVPGLAEGGRRCGVSRGAG
ncbi:hypothetical protein [Pseudarthrobacter oxydans]|uniref:hypothetical protein n=1 Tax=Pseudarthrobacter oxydans TaxID=1671 RepID=UPI00344D3A92